MNVKAVKKAVKMLQSLTPDEAQAAVLALEHGAQTVAPAPKKKRKQRSDKGVPRGPRKKNVVVPKAKRKTMTSPPDPSL